MYSLFFNFGEEFENNRYQIFLECFLEFTCGSYGPGLLFLEEVFFSFIYFSFFFLNLNLF